ncbi:hypothetical protein ACQCN2_12295 [Brevibacillus ginsengisoli]|uniref:hypothetical protein n=1 Tax=Brevibacillus ginsengisoli TaxID=363854 RepID=UPI003CF3B4FA
MQPSLEPLLAVTKHLEQANITYALGGSGLLYSLGLIERVRDWDITTEAPLEEVMSALDHLAHTASPSGDYPFASSYRISFHHAQPEIDLIGNFSILSEAGTCQLPTIPTFRWEGVAVGSPEVWYVAYYLMNRMDKAQLLHRYLKQHGFNSEVMNKLLSQPLPDDLRTGVIALAEASPQ